MAITRTEILVHVSGTEALFADLSYFPVQAIQVVYCLSLLLAVKMFL
jgi:K+ transporter